MCACVHVGVDVPVALVEEELEKYTTPQVRPIRSVLCVMVIMMACAVPRP